MGLLDNLGLGDMLKSLLGQAQSSALPALINAVLAKTQYHDLNGLVAALQEGGLDAQVKSWLGPGANLPITEEQLKAVLGNAQVQDFARHLGLPPGRSGAEGDGAISARNRRQGVAERRPENDVTAHMRFLVNCSD